jgi:hypothetical protein
MADRTADWREQRLAVMKAAEMAASSAGKMVV